MNDVAETLSVSRITVHRLISSGKLKALKVNRAVRIPEESLKEYVDQSMKANTKEQPKKNAMAKDLLKFSGAWKGPKEEIDEIIKYIEESRTEAKF